ncbi:hypothetical protein HCN44_004253 [Aphidius gifuensis]|uniref:Uncharacterized protein n=1 Tax=Aphidius gifuensis TaxID=684658 RepID=A0A834XXR7_APHGI|nr:uncharacterized protein LOC122848520 [Aphidius gifuensis]KAF7994781.1 hypothetical protein HCN44_004253 [Aphidius gifuensis]
MLAASYCREVHFGNMLSPRMQSHVPRCLFGPPNPKDTIELLKDTLDMERKKFTKRWGIDPCNEDKENFQIKVDRNETRSPRKSRTSPYSRQTSIHEYWRSRKNSDTNKKTVSSVDSSKKQQDIQTGN